MKAAITNYAKDILKIDAIGFSPAEILTADLSNYHKFLQEKNYGDMYWLQTRQLLRDNPKQLLPQANSAIIIGLNYFNVKPIKDYEISIYANQLQDYHLWVYKKVQTLAKFLNTTYQDTNRYFVDSAPLLEKTLAKYTQIGWQGKHTCIVSKEFGSWLFLGVILTSLQLPADTPHKNLCGTCTKCIDACPTKALSPYKIQVNKCISYYTIEHKTDIPKELQSKFGKKVFGCDACLQACPFNKWQKVSKHQASSYNPQFPTTLQDFIKLDQNNFNQIFKNTPLRRTGFSRLMRNIAIISNNE